MGLPWYAFYPKDYRDKTSGLTMIQDGAYRRLMDEYYITAEPLQANDCVLFRVCRAFDEAEQVAVLFILAKFFVLGDDGWHHLRIDEEIVRRADISAKRASAGKIGGNSTPNKSKANAQAKPKQLPTHLHSHSKSSLSSDLGPKNRKRAIPDGCPNEEDRSAALAFWAEKGRVDLCGGLADQVDQFRDHHAKEASAMADWPAAWRTWFRNAIRFNRAPSQQPSTVIKVA